MSGILYVSGSTEPNIDQVSDSYPDAQGLKEAALISRDVTRRLERQRLETELSEIVDHLKTPNLTAGKDYTAGRQAWDPGYLRHLFGLIAIDPNSKVLQISTGNGNMAEEFGLNPGNIVKLSSHPFVAQSTLQLPYPDDCFDQVWNTQGLYVDHYLSPEAERLLENAALYIPDQNWTHLHLSGNIRKLLAVLQLKELLRVTKPGGQIRFAGSQSYMNQGFFRHLLFQTEHYQSVQLVDDVDLIAMNKPDALILDQLIELPDAQPSEDALQTDSAYTFTKRPDFDWELMDEFVLKKFQDLLPKDFLRYLQEAKIKIQ